MAPDDVCAALLHGMECTASIGAPSHTSEAFNGEPVNANGESQPPATPSQSRSRRKKRTYFDVNFTEKEEAKAMGAKWDGDMKQWYAASDTVAQRLAARFTAADPESERKFFAVNFQERQRAKLLGARWDRERRMWCVLPAASNLCMHSVLHLLVAYCPCSSAF